MFHDYLAEAGRSSNRGIGSSFHRDPEQRSVKLNEADLKRLDDFLAQEDPGDLLKQSATFSPKNAILNIKRRNKNRNPYMVSLNSRSLP